MAEHAVDVGPLRAEADRLAGLGRTPMYVAVDGRLAAIVAVADPIRETSRAAIQRLRRMGLDVVMLTGDNRRTALAVAAEAGIERVVAEVLPEGKVEEVRRLQAAGQVVAMVGDGINDAPALAQADVGVAMNSGTAAAKEAGNMVDLDSDPTKLIGVVEVGKQMLVTRGALTTFSLANDLAKYFAILPAMFLAIYPQLGALNIMGLATPESAILSAVVFNALIIVALIPLALRGVRFRPSSADRLLRRNLLVYGLGGIVVPFAGIVLIDLVVRLIPGIG
jgi:potassium-transporting ATPase ATP-binding subunit